MGHGMQPRSNPGYTPSPLADDNSQARYTPQATSISRTSSYLVIKPPPIIRPNGMRTVAIWGEGHPSLDSAHEPFSYVSSALLWNIFANRNHPRIGVLTDACSPHSSYMTVECAVRPFQNSHHPNWPRPVPGRDRRPGIRVSGRDRWG